MKKFIVVLAFFALQKAAAQDYTTPAKWPFWIEKDLIYGISTDYLGRPDTLRLDLFKPVGDQNPRRPLVVLTHGGSWLGGCKSEPGIANLAKTFVGHGYAVASIDYRLGWQKDDFVPNPAQPPVWPASYQALYAADSCETIRAIFRGQQDVKGAIRFLKNRAAKDSTCTENVFVGGESAGAFVALAAGFLDRNSEKPDCCFALADAPAPAPNVLNLTTPDCVEKVWAVPQNGLFRPDLGSIDGDLNQNGQSANVAGILSFYGAVPFEGLSKDWLGGPDTPAVYLYHQTCDGVVPFQIAQPMWIISGFCNLGATPWHSVLPLAIGSGAMASFFAASPAPPVFKTDFLPCDAFNPSIALFDCVRFGQNGSYHFTHNLPERGAVVSAFLQPVIDKNKSKCQSVAVDQPPFFETENWKIAPNPFADGLFLTAEKGSSEAVLAELFDAKGERVASRRLFLAAGQNLIFESNGLADGFYFLKMKGEKGVFSARAVLFRS